MVYCGFAIEIGQKSYKMEASRMLVLILPMRVFTKKASKGAPSVKGPSYQVESG